MMVVDAWQRPVKQGQRQNPHTHNAASGAANVPAAYPMRWSTKGCHGHSRTTPQAPQPGLTHVSQVVEET